MKSLISGVMLISMSSAMAAAPQTPTAESATVVDEPLCAGSEYKQFDFWLGDWTVSTPDGNIAGRNQISSEEEGCVLIERWASVSGGSGQSYNFYNPATQKWRQVWVGSGSIIDYEGGLTATGSMRLVGTITYLETAETAPITGEWTLNEDGTVTQHLQQFDADIDEWQDWFTGRYSPIRSSLAQE